MLLVVSRLVGYQQRILQYISQLAIRDGHPPVCIIQSSFLNIAADRLRSFIATLHEVHELHVTLLVMKTKPICIDGFTLHI